MSGQSYEQYLPFGERMDSFVRRGMRIVSRLAIGFGLSAIAAIVLGAAVTDNGFVQVLVTAFATIALWIPAFLLILGIERLFTRRERPTPAATAAPALTNDSWGRLAAIAPSQAHRVEVLQRSFERSRLTLGSADLDPDAHDLCVLIDRRLPELIDRELDDLPPDDRDRGKRVDDLIDLVEQFARHCSRKGSGEEGLPRYNAEVLRRRFEERLSNPF
jgi:hypothetical protein